MKESIEMHRSYREAQDRLDNFVLAGVLAVCAYLGQTNPYAKIGCNAETIYFLSLIIFVIVAYFGFKRIEYTVVGYRLNHQLLDAREKENSSHADQVIESLEMVNLKAARYYKLRNYFMVIGFGIYIVAKYWQVYTT